MSKLLELKSKKGAKKAPKRVGRGNGSGHGTYSTRGRNGQNQRTGGGTRPGFEGGQTPLYRRMAKLKGFKNINRVEYQVVNVGKLNIFDDGSEVNIITLFEKKLINQKGQPIKILGDGELTKKLKISVDSVSKTAKEKIIKAKGEIIEIPQKTEDKDTNKTVKKEK